MVDLEPIADEDGAAQRGGDPDSPGLTEVVHNLARGDAQYLRRLIARHVEFTGSPKGRAILDDWARYRRHFVKIMPVDYRRALQQMQAPARATERPEISLAVGG
jgi:glutamate synthase (NADPH/NADH) large chain